MKILKHSIFLIFLFVMTEDAFAQDWSNLQRFQKENIDLGKPSASEKRIVFMGNSITEQWLIKDPAFFEKYKLINRGIGGQTTSQMLLRFYQDVINLNPEAVVILAGINDIAGNTGLISTKAISENIESMCILARAKKIKVVLCSLLPANKIPWRNVDSVAQKVIDLNQQLKTIASEMELTWVDYYTPMVNDEKGLPEKYSSDGIHPTLEGYQKIESIITPVLLKLRN